MSRPFQAVTGQRMNQLDGRLLGRILRLWHLIAIVRCRLLDLLDLLDIEMIVAPVAIRRVPGLLAQAQETFLWLIDRKGQGVDSSAAVGAVAERLRLRVPAGTPVVFALFKVNLHRLFGHDFGAG
jgi:hypothetical protein